MQKSQFRGAVALAVLAVAGSIQPVAARVHPCQLSTEITYTPQLDGTEMTRAFQVNDTLTCPVSPDVALGAGVASGSRSTGNRWTDPATGFIWQEPAGTATGTCTAQALSAVYIIRWVGGGVTVTQETTDTAAWGSRTSGAVVPSVTLTAVGQQAGQAATMVLATTALEGRSVNASQVSRINTADPLECTETGLTRAFRDGAYVLA
jgi:hypothetical protein